MLLTNFLEAKSILTKSSLPGSDWSINPYNGCTFGCMYCYAAQIARWHHPKEEWGTYIDIKRNAPELLLEELTALHKKRNTKDFGTIFFSSVTDPYCGPEATYQLTRKCLHVLSDFNYQGLVSILTKSPLITRDIDLLQSLKHVSVGLTITSLDDDVSRFLEVHAPPVSARLKTLEILHAQKIPTYAFVGPLLPTVVKNRENLEKLIDKLESLGVSEIWFEHLNISPKIKNRLFDYLKKQSPDLVASFKELDSQTQRKEVDALIFSLMKGRKVKLGLNKPLHHPTTDASRNR